MLIDLSVTPTGGGAGTVNVVEERGSHLNCAPYTGFFSATVSGFNKSGPSGNEYDPRMCELEYYWDWGTLEDYQFSAPQNLYDGNAKHTGGHKNARYTYGFCAQHTFRTVGTHNCSLTVRDPADGTFGTGTFQVVVTNPDAAFAGTNTIYLDPTGTFPNAPAGCRQLTTSNFQTAFTTWGQGQETTPKRFMLARGQSFTTAGLGVGAFFSQTPTTHIVAAPGAGAKPTLTWTTTEELFSYHDGGSGLPDNTKDWVMQNIEVIGNFDATVPSTGTKECLFIRVNGPNLAVWDQCNLHNMGAVVLDAAGTALTTNGHGVAINDTIVDNVSYGGLMQSEGFFAFTGSRITTPQNAFINGTDGANGWGFRSEPEAGASPRGAMRLYQNSDMFRYQGWSGLATNIDIATQAPIRFYFRNGYRNVVSACNLECGYDHFSTVVSAGSGVTNFVIEKNFVLGDFQTNSFIPLNVNGVVVRNNILILPESAGREDVDISHFIGFIQVDGGPTATSPVKVYNNTFVNRSVHQGLNREGITVGAGGAGLEVVNNVEHQPVASYTVDAPLGDDTNQFTIRNFGWHKTTADYRSTTVTLTTAGQTDFYDPEAGSAALNDLQAGSRADSDFRGVRPVVNRGAWG